MGLLVSSDSNGSLVVIGYDGYPGEVEAMYGLNWPSTKLRQNT